MIAYCLSESVVLIEGPYLIVALMEKHKLVISFRTEGMQRNGVGSQITCLSASSANRVERLLLREFCIP